MHSRGGFAQSKPQSHGTTIVWCWVVTGNDFKWYGHLWAAKTLSCLIRHVSKKFGKTRVIIDLAQRDTWPPELQVHAQYFYLTNTTGDIPMKGLSTDIIKSHSNHGLDMHSYSQVLLVCLDCILLLLVPTHTCTCSTSELTYASSRIADISPKQWCWVGKIKHAQLDI